MRRMLVGMLEILTLEKLSAPKLFQVILGVCVAPVIAAVASANAPVVVTDVLTFEEQVVAPGAMAVATNGSTNVEAANRCPFPIVFSAHDTRTDKTFENGDIKRHIEKNIMRQANGHTASETDMMEVFIDHADPLTWKITGRFGQMFLDARLIWLESGQLSMPGHGTGIIVDPRPGPKAMFPDVCAILSE